MAAGGEDNIYQFNAKDIDGQDVSMEKYNQLQPLYEKYESDGFRVAAFPCNQFGGQEPWPELEIKKWVQDNYKVTFDMFSKIDVNGKNAHPMFTWLKKKQGGFLVDDIKWNFTKFLVNREGIPTKRYSPTTAPNECEDDIAGALGVPKK